MGDMGGRGLGGDTQSGKAYHKLEGTCLMAGEAGGALPSLPSPP